jgi:enoyl-CoA hydratase/carnithine racemase
VNSIHPQATAAGRDREVRAPHPGHGAGGRALRARRRQPGSDIPLQDGLNFEATFFGLLAGTDDCREGMRAFLEKRPARFTGK